MDFEFEQLALDHDNVGGLLSLRELNPPMFYRYRFPVATAWAGQEGERNDSRGFPKPFGLPSFTWTLGVITAEELVYLYTWNDLDVTAHTLNKWPDGDYFNYNTHTHVVPPTPDQWRGGFWTNVVIQFLQAEVIV